MKALSIPTGFIGLAAVSSAAVINGPRFSVNLCTERDFNNCTHIVVESDKCTDLGPDLKNNVSSLKPDPGVICGFMDKACDDPWGATNQLFLAEGNVSKITTISRIDSIGATENWENRIQSYACEPHLSKLETLAISIPYNLLEPAGKARSLRPAFHAERWLHRDTTLANRGTSTSVNAVKLNKNPPWGVSFGVGFYSEPWFHGDYQHMDAQGACVPLPNPNMKIGSITIVPNPSCYFFRRSDCNQGANDHVFHLSSNLPDLSATPRNGPDGTTENYQDQIGSFRCTSTLKARGLSTFGAPEKAVVDFNDMEEGSIVPGETLVHVCPERFGHECTALGVPLYSCGKVSLKKSILYHRLTSKIVSLARPGVPEDISSLWTEREASCYFYDNAACNPNSNTFYFSGAIPDLSVTPVDSPNGSTSNHENQIKGLRCIEFKVSQTLSDRDSSVALSSPALTTKTFRRPQTVEFCTGRNFEGPCVNITAPLRTCITLNSDLSTQTSSLSTRPTGSSNCYFYLDDGCQSRGLHLDGEYSNLSNVGIPGLPEDMLNYEDQIRAFACFQVPHGA